MRTGASEFEPLHQTEGKAGNGPISVVIVEDHPQFRDALTEAIGGCPDLRLLAVCRDLPAGMDFVEQNRPDVLLVDLGLPSGSGMVLLRCAPVWWGARCTSAVLTMTGDEEHMLNAAQAGSKGCLFKSDTPQDWLATVRMLANGQGAMHGNFARHLLHREASGNAQALAATNAPARAAATWAPANREVLVHLAAGYTMGETAARLALDEAEVGRRLREVYDGLFRPGPNLSRRELQLLRLLNQGQTFKQCAELMGVSESTTKTQAARAYEKLGAHNLQMALYAARNAGFLY